MPTELDWARLAAFIDGEGTIFIRDRKQTPKDILKGRNRGHVLVVSIHNTDPRLVHWCKEMFGGCAYQSRPKIAGTGRINSIRRTVFQWIASQKKAAEILKSCLPYFIIKREQAEVALAFHKTISRRWGKGGLPYGMLEHRESFRVELKRLKHIDYPDGPVEPSKPNLKIVRVPCAPRYRLS